MVVDRRYTMKGTSYRRDKGESFIIVVGSLSAFAGIILGGIGIVMLIDSRYLSEIELIRAYGLAAGGVSMFLFGLLLWGVGGILSVLKDIRLVNEIAFLNETEQPKEEDTGK